MKMQLCILSFLLFAMFSGYAHVVLPDQNLSVSVVGFMPSALEELKANGILVLFDEEGRPVAFFENGTLKDHVKFGNLTLFPYDGNSTYVVGSFEFMKSVREIAGARMNYGEAVDQELLREIDYLRYLYYSQRYGSLEGFLRQEMGINSKEEAIEFLKNLQINEAADALPIYDALQSGVVGYSQYKELLNALSDIAGEDLAKYVNKEVAEMLSRYWDKFGRELLKQSLKSLLKNLNKDEVKMLYDILKQIDYKKLYEVARDYIREAARSGDLDEIMRSLKRSEIESTIRDAAVEGVKEFTKINLLDYLPKHLYYYTLFFAFILLAFLFRRLG